jgi:hypothetical protein
VPTRTAIVTPTPTPTSRPPTPTQTPVLLVPDLSQWPTTPDDPIVRRTYDPATGDYLVEILEERYNASSSAGRPLADFVASVEIAVRGGPGTTTFGLIFRQQGDVAGKPGNDGYLFLGNAQGEYSFWREDVDGKWAAIVDWRPAPGIVKLGGEPNTLGVRCKGPAVRLSINEQDVYATPGASLTAAGRIGLFAGAPGGAGNATKVVYRTLVALPAA